MYDNIILLLGNESIYGTITGAAQRSGNGYFLEG